MKITDEQREVIRKSKASAKVLAKRYGISQCYVYKIKRSVR